MFYHRRPLIVIFFLSYALICDTFLFKALTASSLQVDDARLPPFSISPHKKSKAQFLSSLESSKESQFIRPLGGYERLLSRLTPGTSSVSLSHVCVAILDYAAPHDDILLAVSECMQKHPMLTAYIAKDNDSVIEGEKEKQYWIKSSVPVDDLAKDVVRTIKAANKYEFSMLWQRALEYGLNEAAFPSKGPLWKLVNIRLEDGTQSAWIFVVNHGIDDQTSVNIVIKDMIYSLEKLNAERNGKGVFSSLSTTPSTMSGLPTSPSTSTTTSSPSTTTTTTTASSTSPFPLFPISSIPFPPSIETAVSPGLPGLRTVVWALFQLANMLSFPAMVPTRVKNLALNDPSTYNLCANPSNRRTFCECFSLSRNDTQRLVKSCAKEKVTVTHALAAAMMVITAVNIQEEEAIKLAPQPWTLGEVKVGGGIDALDERDSMKVALSKITSPATSSIFMSSISNVNNTREGNAASSLFSNKKTPIKSQYLRFLLSVGLRPFGVTTNAPSSKPSATDFTQSTVACASGAVDYIMKVPSLAASCAAELNAAGGRPFLFNNEQSKAFWDLARESQFVAKKIINTWNFVPESVRLFGLGMDSFVDILTAVEMDARNPQTMGRGFSCGVSNMGRVDVRAMINTMNAADAGIGSGSSAKKINLKEMYYGTSHGRNGVLCQLSCMTLCQGTSKELLAGAGNEDRSTFHGTLQFTEPLISRSMGSSLADRLVSILKGIGADEESTK